MVNDMVDNFLLSKVKGTLYIWWTWHLLIPYIRLGATCSWFIKNMVLVHLNGQMVDFRASSFIKNIYHTKHSMTLNGQVVDHA